MENKKKIWSIVAAVLVALGSILGVCYKLWWGEEMPVADTEEAVVEEVTEAEAEVAADTVDFVEVAAEVAE